MEKFLKDNLSTGTPPSSPAPSSRLESLSDESINSLYSQLDRYQAISSDYRIEELLGYEDNPTIQEVGLLLDETLVRIIDKGIHEMDREDFNIISETLVTNLSHRSEKRDIQFKRVLRTMLLISILNDREYCTVDNKLLKINYCSKDTESLAFIWLQTLKQKRLEERALDHASDV
jgi:hypothetical protein